MNEKVGCSQLALNEKELQLIRLMREIGFGEVKIIIQDKVPIRVEEFKKSYKLQRVKYNIFADWKTRGAD